MSDAEFLAMAAQDRQALKDKIDRRTTAAMLGTWVRTLERWHDDQYGPRRIPEGVRSATAAPKSKLGSPSTVGVAIGHVAKEANVAGHTSPCNQLHKVDTTRTRPRQPLSE